MPRWVKGLIVMAAAALYAAVAYAAIMAFAIFNWIVLHGACDSGCGADPDRPTHIAAFIAEAIFAVGLLAGAVWVARGKRASNPSPDRTS